MAVSDRPAGWRRVAVVGAIACVCSGVSVVTPQAAFAAVLPVPGAFPTIQAALDAAAPSGDTILVDPGTYNENLDFHGKDVRLESTGGPATTTIDVDGGTAVRIGPAGAFVGFTVTGAVEAFGAGMDVSGTGTLVQGNIFDGNAQTAGGFGAAIGGNNASPTIDRNIFRDNSCDGQFLSAVVSFVNGSSPRISNNLFAHNPCRAINMTLPEGTAPVVINNTMVDNAVGVRVDARVSTAGHVYRNNVIVGNGTGLHVEFGSVANNPTWDHNLVFGNDVDYAGITDQTGIAGNVSADPLFADPAADDFHMLPGSPAVDIGSDQASPSVDLDGNARPVDGDGDGVAGVDLGAYELQPAGVRPVAIDIKPGSSQNVINRLDRGTVLVATLATADFDAPAVVDRTSLTFGRTGDEQSLRSCLAGGRDVNHDDRADLVCAFVIRETNFQLGDTEGVLKATTTDGARLEGRDVVLIVV